MIVFLGGYHMSTTVSIIMPAYKVEFFSSGTGQRR